MPSLTVPGPAGEVDVEVPPGVQPGDVQVLRGEGMPSLEGRRRGNLHVHVRVHVPRRLDEEQRGLVEQLGEALGADAYPTTRTTAASSGASGTRSAERGMTDRVVRVTTRVPLAEAEEARAAALELLPGGFEELEVDGAFALALYVDESDVEAIRRVFYGLAGPRPERRKGTSAACPASGRSASLPHRFRPPPFRPRQLFASWQLCLPLLA